MVEQVGRVTPRIERFLTTSAVNLDGPSLDERLEFLKRSGQIVFPVMETEMVRGR